MHSHLIIFLLTQVKIVYGTRNKFSIQENFRKPHLLLQLVHTSAVADHFRNLVDCLQLSVRKFTLASNVPCIFHFRLLHHFLHTMVKIKFLCVFRFMGFGTLFVIEGPKRSYPGARFFLFLNPYLPWRVYPACERKVWT